MGRNNNYLLLLAAATTLFIGSCTQTAEVTQPAAEVPEYEVQLGTDIYPVVEPERFDNGKMWTFEYAPEDYFAEEYELELTEEWLEQARMGSVRLPNCTGSFVSASGLVLTNHHCTREQVTAVTQEGENLTDEGFYATNLSDERHIPGFFVDQMIAIEDVTEAIYSALSTAEDTQNTTAIIAQARQVEIERIEDMYDDDSIFVDVVALYNGALYSAYTFKRYEDVRLVMVPEMEAGFFGGDPDNFTYPRYTLDMALLRVYENDEPFQSEHYFPWSENGAQEGDGVFVVGNPGSTSRLHSVAQLEYTRDVAHPTFLDLLDEVSSDFVEFEQQDPQTAELLGLRNFIFQLQNAVKAYSGGLETLESDTFMGRRLQSELEFISLLREDDDLNERFGTVLQEIEDIADQKKELGDVYYALNGLNPGTILSSGTLQRALLVGNMYAHMQEGDEEAASYYEGLIARTIEWPEVMDDLMMESRFHRIANTYSQTNGEAENPLLYTEVSGGLNPAAYTDRIMSESALTSVEGTLNMIGTGIDLDDPAVQFGVAYGPVFEYTMEFMAEMETYEEDLNRRLGRARYEVYGTDVPPDATFSIRLQDGRVASYEYNGTIAPAHTTFYGMLDRHYSHGEVYPWSLPNHWISLPEDFQLSTPLNLVTTNDIIGGNSGSPLLSDELELVGLIFDGNIESLSGDFIYTDATARAISVDSRGMLEALRHIYQADRIVDELLSR